MSQLLSCQIFVAQPQCSNDADIERPLRVMTPRVRRKRKADERRLALRRLPTINADERSGRDVPPGLLERFPDRGRGKRLAKFEMTGGLVDSRAVSRLFFNDEEGMEILIDFNDLLSGLKRRGVGLEPEETEAIWSWIRSHSMCS